MATIGAGVTTLSAVGVYDDVPNDIIPSTLGKGQDLPDVPERQSNITVSIETIVMSALIFITILAWFEFLRVWFDNVFNTDIPRNYNAIYHRLWYAIFVTALAIVLLYIVYRIASR